MSLDPRSGCVSDRGVIKIMRNSLFNRNVIRLILTAPPAKALCGVPTEESIAIM